jgi:dephospho-CoA kinase
MSLVSTGPCHKGTELLALLPQDLSKGTNMPVNSSTWPYSEVVVLTGVRHSGKTTASRLFKELGAEVISADELAKRSMLPGTTVHKQICDFFGPAVCNSDGSLNTAALAARIYGNPEEKRKLESFVHPAVRDMAKSAFEAALKGTAPLVVYECPLFFEADLDALGFKSVLALQADEEQTLARIMTKDNISREEALKRVASQLSQEEKMRRSDIILDNRQLDPSGVSPALRNQIQEAFLKLKRS